MPELPEVETVVRTLAPKLIGRRIVDATFSSHHVVRQSFPALRKRVRNQQVKSVERHGKFIVLTLDQGVLVIHLGMTGKLLLDSEPGPYARAIFKLDRGLLVYDDIRHFGRIEWSAQLPERAAALGPDALDISLEDFRRLLKTRKTGIKPLLLNQRFLRGMGRPSVLRSLMPVGTGGSSGGRHTHHHRDLQRRRELRGGRAFSGAGRADQ